MQKYVKIGYIGIFHVNIFAMFRAKPEWGWGALPQSYTDSAYLQSDEKAIQGYFSTEAK